MSHPLPPVLLLHGWGGSFNATWEALGWVRLLRESGREVMRVDLPGHGNAAGSDDPAAYADLVADVAAWLPLGGVVDIIAFSLGAKIALALASDQPAVCRRLVAIGVGANALAPERAAAPVVQALQQGVVADTPPAVRALLAYALADDNDPARLAAVLQRAPNPLLGAERLKTLTCSTLFLIGQDDAIAQPVEPLAELVPGATVHVLPALDHLAILSDRDTQQLAVQFLQS